MTLPPSAQRAMEKSDPVLPPPSAAASPRYRPQRLLAATLAPFLETSTQLPPPAPARTMAGFAYTRFRSPVMVSPARFTLAASSALPKSSRLWSSRTHDCQTPPDLRRTYLTLLVS